MEQILFWNLSKICVFDSFPIDMGDWAAILEACCRHQKLQTKFHKLQQVTSGVQRIIQPRGKTVTSKDVYSEAMIEPGLRFYWNSIENFHSSEKQQSGAVIFWEIKNEKNNFWNKIQEFFTTKMNPNKIIFSKYMVYKKRSHLSFFFFPWESESKPDNSKDISKWTLYQHSS